MSGQVLHYSFNLLFYKPSETMLTPTAMMACGTKTSVTVTFLCCDCEAHYRGQTVDINIYVLSEGLSDRQQTQNTCLTTQWVHALHNTRDPGKLLSLTTYILLLCVNRDCLETHSSIQRVKLRTKPGGETLLALQLKFCSL